MSALKGKYLPGFIKSTFSKLPRPEPLRTMTNSPISTIRDNPSPLLHQSFNMNAEDKTKSEGKKKEAKAYKRNTKAKALTQVEKNKGMLKAYGIKTLKKDLHDSVEDDVKLEIEQSPEKILEKARLETDPEVLERVKEIERKGKVKLQKVVNIFREEALKTDYKLNLLMNENKMLKDILLNPQLPSTKPSSITVKAILSIISCQNAEKNFEPELNNLLNSCKKTVRKVEDYEGKIPHWLDCLNTKPEDLNDLLIILSIKISQEQKRRFKSEEETSKMIEWEENHIQELEQKILKAEEFLNQSKNLDN